MNIINLDYWEDNPEEAKISGAASAADARIEELRNEIGERIGSASATTTATAFGTISDTAAALAQAVTARNGGIFASASSLSSGSASSTVV